jgi:hypothetical protein
MHASQIEEIYMSFVSKLSILTGAATLAVAAQMTLGIGQVSAHSSYNQSQNNKQSSHYTPSKNDKDDKNHQTQSSDHDQKDHDDDKNKPSSTPSKPDNHDQEVKVTLCHATGSQHNPYVRITISVNGAYNGHLNHQDDRDIVPTFTYQGKQYFQNWDTNGKTIYNDNCGSGNSCKPHQGQGQGSGPTTPSTPATPVTPQTTPTTPATPATPVATPAATPVAAQLANTGSNSSIIITTIISLLIIAASLGLGFATRRKLVA